MGIQSAGMRAQNEACLCAGECEAVRGIQASQCDTESLRIVQVWPHKTGLKASDFGLKAEGLRISAALLRTRPIHATCGLIRSVWIWLPTAKTRVFMQNESSTTNIARLPSA